MALLKSDFFRTLGVRSLITKSHTAFETNSVFLSHSSKDSDLLPGVLLFLEVYGAKVYLDERDERMPFPPNPQTAKLLKREIRTSSKFVVLVSEKSKSSRWVPWELGLADGLIKDQNIALLPTTETGLEELWSKQEYLGLYSQIRTNSNRDYFVFDPLNFTQIELGKWLSSRTIEKELS